MNQVYFKNIQKVISGELSQANLSIKVAVAWLTDMHLIKALESCIMRGVDISIIFYNDKINDKELFRELIRKGANIRVTKTLMHNKFCLIDGKTVINGSYNWTYNAKINNENIQVTKDLSFYNQFDSEFFKIFEQSINITEFMKSDEEKLQDFISNNKLLLKFPYLVKKEVREETFCFLIRDIDDIRKFQKGVESITGGISRFFKTNFENCFNESRLMYFDNVIADSNEDGTIFCFENDTIVVENYYKSDAYTTYGIAYLISKNGVKQSMIYFDRKDEVGNYYRKDKSIKYNNQLKEIN